MPVEKENIFELWKKTGLLNSVEEYRQPNLAQCLEKQHTIVNNQLKNYDFARISVPLIIRLFNLSTAFRNNDVVVKNHNETQHAIVFNINIDNEFPGPSNRGGRNLDAESAATLAIAQKMATEIDSVFVDKKKTDIIFDGLFLINNKIHMYFA